QTVFWRARPDGEPEWFVCRLHTAQPHYRTRTDGGLATSGCPREHLPRGDGQNDGSGQGVSPERICPRMPGTGDCAPCRVQRQRERGRVGRTHHDPAKLPSQFENPKTGGRDIWLAQDGGRIQTEPVSRTRTDTSLGLLCSGHLQLAADGAVGTGELNGAVSVKSPAKRHQNGVGQVK